MSDSLGLQIPIISSDMDTVTEARMAIAMALNGGLGLIHYNMAPRDQVKAVARVKRHIHGLIQDPITVGPGQTIGELLAMIEAKRYDFSTFPVVDGKGRLCGLVSGNVVKARYGAKKVSEVMTPRSQLMTELESDVAKDPINAADRFFTSHVGINKMLVVDRGDHLRGLVTASDVERITGESKSRRKPARDSQFRLVVGRRALAQAQARRLPGQGGDRLARRQPRRGARRRRRDIHRARPHLERWRCREARARRLPVADAHRRQRDKRRRGRVSRRVRRGRSQDRARARARSARRGSSPASAYRS